MSEHTATVVWKSAAEGSFVSGKYSREHTWSFDGGATVLGSSSPSNVRVPYSNPAGVDPEEAFVAALASCHMLTFLYLARKRGFDIVEYRDHALGTMSKNEHGKPWISSVVLSPRIQYRGAPPTPDAERQLHEAAHHDCIIANSVKTDVRVEPRLAESVAL